MKIIPRLLIIIALLLMGGCELKSLDDHLWEMDEGEVRPISLKRRATKYYIVIRVLKDMYEKPELFIIDIKEE